MKKIISLFARRYEGDRLVYDEIVPGAQWVVMGEGIAARKYDGTCCLIRNGILYRRYDAKQGKQPPVGFEPAQEADPITGHWPGWLQIDDGPNSRWHREAYMRDMEDGTYELCGPKINGNPEHLLAHILIRHGSEVLHDCPRQFDEIRDYLSKKDIEGIVWHHNDGRMVKIKTKDFGLARNETN